MSHPTRNRRRVVAAAAASVMALTGLGATAQPAQAAVTGTVDQASLTVRQGPNSAYDAYSTLLTMGTVVSVSCKTPGNTVGVSRYWYKIGERRYVPADGVSGAATATLCTEKRYLNGVGTSDYPYTANDGKDSNFTEGQCTSFVAWRMGTRLGIKFHRQWEDTADQYNPAIAWGGANTWDDVAPSAFVKVGATPAVGSVAVSNTTGTVGHVAYVSKVNTDGTFVIEEMNWGGAYRYNVRTARVGTGALDFQRFIYF